MSPWYGIGLFCLALVASVAIRIPHDQLSKKTQVKETRRGPLELFLLGLIAVGGLLLPVLFIFTPLLSFANYGFSPVALGAGCLATAAWLWLFHRAHADLGRNWSATLEVRDDHHLITTGVYTWVRHPMYSSLFLHAGAQALLLANWIAGPAMFCCFVTMFALRLRPEEKMMQDTFGEQYSAYCARTKRLIPGVW